MPHDRHDHQPARTFFTVQQIAQRHPAFTLRTLRHWIFNAKERYSWKDRQRVLVPGNGFDRVIVRLARRVYIDESALFDWLDNPHGQPPSTTDQPGSAIRASGPQRLPSANQQLPAKRRFSVKKL